MAILHKALYLISTGLLVPVIVLLLLLFIRSLLLIGSFYALYVERIRERQAVDQLLKSAGTGQLTDDDTSIPRSGTPGGRRTLFATYAARIVGTRNHRAEAEKTLGDFELAGERSLEGARILLRLGPMLGLMGTLIPMAPALAGLAAGDLAALADNMQIAFSTTVIGLFVGGMGFFSYTVRRRWFREDYHHLAYLRDALCGEERVA